jgi:hypothetical protein
MTRKARSECGPFRLRRRVLPKVEAALVRVGRLVYSPDGGRSFLPRCAA